MRFGLSILQQLTSKAMTASGLYQRRPRTDPRALRVFCAHMVFRAL